MIKIAGAILAVIVIGVGVTFLPAIKIVTEAIFNAFGGTADMPAFLTLMVSAWPIIILLFFAYGAYILVKRSQ